MARQKHRWTMEEEEALTAGVEKYGQGKWKVILSDPQFGSCLSDRSNIDLKDKWRNMTVSGGGSSSRNSVRTPMMEWVNSNPPLSFPEPSADALLLEYSGKAGPSRSSPDIRMSPDYKAVILEALSFFEDPNGLDINDILNFIESKYKVPENCRKSVNSELRKLVLAGEVQKILRYLDVVKTRKWRRILVQDCRLPGKSRAFGFDIRCLQVNNCYKLKGASLGAETSQQEDVFPNNIHNHKEEQNAQETSAIPISTETPEEAAARLVAEAENLDETAIKTCKRRDKLEGLLEESMVMQLLAEKIYNQCCRDGIVVLKA